LKATPLKFKAIVKIPPSVAYHEAGHAALAIHLRFGLKRVSLVPGRDYAGICIQHPQPSFARLDCHISDSITKRVEKKMMVALAGAEAQRKFAPTSVRGHHAHSDVESVFEGAFHLCGSSEEAWALVNLLRIRTRNPSQLRVCRVASSTRLAGGGHQIC
jgi:hypothetical protein